MNPSNRDSQTTSVASGRASCIFTIDVEDWFHILDLPSTPDISKWPQLPTRVEANFMHLLDILSERQVHATCFFLGWIAERFPHLVRETVGRGHEVASHGYAHRLVYSMSRAQFAEDARHSRLLIEDVCGQAVSGYRSAGFSATRAVPWFFDELAEAGYEYDSSVFPAHRGHGGDPESQLAPHRVAGNSLVEFPITVAEVGNARLCLFGGGYLRLFPYWLIRCMTQQVLSAGRPAIFYVHPREIDPEHPRLSMPWKRRFKSYVNLSTTERKVRSVIQDFPVTDFRTYLANSPLSALQTVAAGA